MRHRFAAFSGYLLLILLFALLTVLPAGPVVQQASADTAKCENCDAGGSVFGHSANSLRRHGLIRYTPQQIETENRLLETAPLVKTEPIESVKLLSDGYTEGAARNLLPLLSYDPTQRDQGYGCGSCWVWAGTGCLEVALRNQLGIENNKLAVQYFTSTYSGPWGWACCGGNASEFASHYNNNLKKAIPWSNTNAAYVDGSRTCYGSTAMPAGSISITPNYPISSVTAARIPTYYSYDGVNQATAIQNIKNVLDQNKAIYFGFTLANDADWDQFFDFWNYEYESYLWPYGYSDGDPYISGQTAGHGVLCVGYDDTPDGTANDYWVMLNSWGTAAGRPNGLFRVPMYYNYNSYINGYGHSTRWWTIEPTFVAPVLPSAPTLLSPANGATVYGSSVTFSWSSVSGATNYAVQVSASPTFSTLFHYNYTYGATSFTYTDFPNNGTTYYWRARSHNAAGWGDWSNTRSLVNGSGGDTAISPDLLSPANGATASGSTITFLWSSVSGATNYAVQVSANPTFSPLFHYNYTYGTTSKTYTDFPNNGTTYYWRARSYNGIGWGNWSSSRSFINGAGGSTPVAPTLLSPANGGTASGSSITFSWSPVSGATNYAVQVSTSPTFSPLFHYNYSYGNTYFTYTDFPNSGTTYYWRARSYNASGWGDWSNSRTFINGS